MKRRSAASLFIAAIVLVASNTEPDAASDFGKLGPSEQVWLVADRRPVAADDALDMAAAADIVVLGETHDNARHHELQASLIGALAARGRYPALVFEMIDAAQEDSLARYLGEADANAGDLGAVLNWEERGWPSWDLYEPIAAVAMANDLPILAGSSVELESLVREGGFNALTPAAREGLSVMPMGETDRRMLSRQLAAAHCFVMPEEAVAAMVDVQRLRDAVMADGLLRAIDTERRSAILIAGSEHARWSRGVPANIESRRPDLNILSIAFRETAPDPMLPEDDDGPSNESGPALEAYLDSDFDIVWLTAAVARDDPCVRLRERLRRQGDGDPDR